MKTKTIVYMLFYLIIIVPLPQLVSAQALADSQQQAKAKVECDKAREFWQQQNFEKAMVHFEKAAQLDPSNEDYFSNAAVCAMQLLESFRAVNYLKKAISASIAKKQFQKIQAYNDQISMILNVWPDWAEQKYEATSVLPEKVEAVQAQQKWYELMSEVENSTDRNDPHVIQMLKNAIQIALKNFGDSHPQTLNSQKILAEIYMDSEQFDKALPIFSKVAEAMIQPLNALHPLRISCLQSMARINEMLEKYDAAEPLYLEAIQISKQSMGVDHPETLINMYFLALMYVQQLRYKEAADLFEEMMPLYIDRQGITHPDTLTCMNDLANIYKHQMKTSQAEAIYLSVTQQKINIYGEQSPQTIETQLELADLYRQKASFTDAEAILQKAIAHAKELGDAHKHLLFNLKTELARVYEEQGRLDEAEPLMQAVYEFDRTELGEKHPNTLTDKSHMASILRKKGQLHAAEKLFEQVYNERKSISGEKDPNTIIDLNNLALVLEEQGLYEQAEPLLKKAVHLAEGVLGLEHTTTLATMNNLALIHESQGVFKRARPLYLKVIQTYSKRYGEDHPNTIASINNLAYLYMLEKKYDDALEKFQVVFDRWKKRLSINHQNTLKAMNNLGRVYHKKGELEKAHKFLHQALTLRIKNFGETHIDSIRSTIDVAALYVTQKKFKPALLMIKKAIDFSTASLGPHHPYTFEALNVQAQLFQQMKNIQKACETYALIFERRNKFFERVLWATGENARNGYIRLHQGEQDAYLTLLAMSNAPNSAHDILNVSLQRKGLLLKIASEIEQVTQMLDKPELNKLSQQLMDKKKKLAALTLSGPAETGATNFLLEIEQLENNIEELQGELGRASIRFKTTQKKISPEGVVSRLGEQDLLLDYFIFMNHIKGKRQLLAVVAQKTDADQLSYSKVVFDDMTMIDKWIENYRTTIQDEDADEGEVMEEGLILYEKIWQPLVSFFNEKTSIYIVPDGTLNILPFDALVDEDEEYLLQIYDLKILSSGRDLLLTDAQSGHGPFLIIAGPDYNSEYLVKTETVKTIKRKRKSRGKRNADLLKGLRMASFGMRGLSFSPLPGAEREGQEINALCKKERSTNLYLKNQAEEELLRHMNQAPDILHIATHGFFLKSQENLTKRLVKLQRSMDPLKLIPPPGDNPLLRAGLAFAGINKNAQFLGEIDTDNDGVLTAIEVLGLNLFGTRLVVLSACETGLGEIHTGEGVYGLRRAFQEAGARTVINSLWEVSDQGTQRLMTALYKNILSGMPVRKAFRKAQLGMKNSIMWSHPYIWSAFFMVGR
jgi:CHAT domain-containing protein/Tfp pilus assembly protein PilF